MYAASSPSMRVEPFQRNTSAQAIVNVLHMRLPITQSLSRNSMIQQRKRQ